jgi:flagellar biosynthesis protein FlhA
MSYTDIQKVFQQLLREHVSIRPIDTILEVLVDAGRQIKQTDDLVDRVRERIGAGICQRILNPKGELHVMTLAPDIERAIVAAVRQRDGASIGTDLAHIDGVLTGVARQAELMMSKSNLPVLLCPGHIRRHLRGLLQRSLPHVTVLGVNEVPSTVIVKSFGTVTTTA